MKRDITKALAQYYERFKKHPAGEGAFYPSDVMQIIERNKEEGSDLLYRSITDALEVGFIIGCRYQARQDRARRARGKK